jgi:putative transposase
MISMVRLCGVWRGNRAMPVKPGVFWRWPRFTTAARARTRPGPAAWECRSCATGLSVSTPYGLLNGKAPGARSILDDSQRQALRRIVEGGPIPAVHSVVRWRLIDLAQWVFEEFRVSISKQTLSRELRTMGFRKLSARPRHHAQDVEATADFKKTSVISWTKSPQKRRAAN